MSDKREHLIASYENLEVDFEFKELKQSFALQKEKWQSLYAFYTSAPDEKALT